MNTTQNHPNDLDKIFTLVCDGCALTIPIVVRYASSWDEALTSVGFTNYPSEGAMLCHHCKSANAIAATR